MMPNPGYPVPEHDSMRIAATTILFVIASAMPATAQLYVGIETGSAQPMFVSDLSGFPSVTWGSFHAIDVSGAAARPDGTLYVCNGAFTTALYEIQPGQNPSQISTIDIDISGMAFGRDTLYGYSNYATPKGIYEIDPSTGTTTLVLDVYTSTGYRFFALDYNPVDDLFYGYTEYGTSGLYSIDIDTGVMTFLTGTIPASNGQGRGMAVGNNTVYLTATRGDDGIGFHAYDLSQGVGGSWVEFDNAYPNHHSTGGAAWVPLPEPGVSFCFGDPGSGVVCPCGNDNDGSVPGSGCANGQYSSGALLAGTGEASLAADTLILYGQRTQHDQFGLFFQADNSLSNGQVWGDGLRCAGGALKRLGTATSDGNGNSDTTGYGYTISSRAGNIAPGDTKHYQLWYRNPLGSPCGSDFNTSNGYSVTWTP
jgi:hypothetical protein